MSFFHSKPDQRTNEDVFFAYYSRLLAWALQITRNDRSEAEDLVHDFYLRVTRISKSIDQMEQLEHYLFKVLRNLYYSRLRRAGRVPLNNLTIVDYDSVEQGLAVADRREQLFSRTYLRQICGHACQRKSTARSASILILRFFHGYYPIEVMKILQASRSSVDRSLQVARNEARLCLERPDVLRSISPSTKPPMSFSMKGEDTQQLFLELQEAIFSAVEGECFDPAALEQRYASESEPSGMTTQELSHLVSCRICLDRVNVILHLPLLADRSPDGSIDRDNTAGPGGESGSHVIPISKRLSKKRPSFRTLERRARELFEHRPSSLEIVVDGDVRSSQKVTAEINELRLKLGHKEEPSFIEVLSEQGFCMAFLQVDEPVSADKLEQIETVIFSDDRSLALALSFTAEGPIVHVLYRDPVVMEAVAIGVGTESASGTVVSDAKPMPVQTLPQFVQRYERWIPRGTSSLSAWLQWQFRRLFIRNMNPFLASAALLTLGALVCLWLWHKPPPPMSANMLLQRAEAADQAAVSSINPKVISQKVRIRTAPQTFERTIHRDASGRRKPKQQPLDQHTAVLSAKLEGAGVNWDEPLSAVTYKDWREHSHVTGETVRKTEDNLLTLTTTIAGANVTEESLTVRVTDFHPIMRTISFRDTGNVEIAELDYDVMPWGAANSDWFEPAMRAAISDAPTMHAVVHLPHMLSDLELDEAELAARTTLNQLHADTGEPISLVRSTNGIDVKGVVDTNARKRELLFHLSHIPNVHILILSAEEIGPRLPSRVVIVGGQPRQEDSTQEHPSPLEQYLHEKNLPMDQLVPASDNLLDGSLRILQLGVHLSELQSRFRETDQLPTDKKNQLETLSRNYIATITANIYANQQILLSLGFFSARSVPGTRRLDDPGRGIEEQFRRYRQLCLEMVSSETGQARPAPVITGEILDVGEQIHLYLANMSVTAQKDNH